MVLVMLRDRWEPLPPSVSSFETSTSQESISRLSDLLSKEPLSRSANSISVNLSFLLRSFGFSFSFCRTLRSFSSFSLRFLSSSSSSFSSSSFSSRCCAASLSSLCLLSVSLSSRMSGLSLDADFARSTAAASSKGPDGSIPVALELVDPTSPGRSLKLRRLSLPLFFGAGGGGLSASFWMAKPRTPCGIDNLGGRLSKRPSGAFTA
mmetsp:Transcript_96309/g.201225  ORF Transcript_96309/g.201225 Transcript_96309/m.201225 type:complete len:207 (-) Transcript_96309:73-693(-)